jgi:ADP-ribose pyrophosphatase YjhB (NUDIX family)
VPPKTARPKPASGVKPAKPKVDPDDAVYAGVAAVIVDEHGRLLVGVRRGHESVGGGYTAMPGGKMKFGESIFDAVERETLEETGLVVKAIQQSQVRPELFIVNHYSDMGHYITIFVECRVVGGRLENREPDKCAAWERLTYQQLAARLPQEALAAWQDGRMHPALCWTPVPQLAHFRDHLGLR